MGTRITASRACPCCSSFQRTSAAQKEEMNSQQQKSCPNARKMSHVPMYMSHVKAVQYLQEEDGIYLIKQHNPATPSILGIQRTRNYHHPDCLTRLDQHMHALLWSTGHSHVPPDDNTDEPTSSVHTCACQPPSLLASHSG